MHMFNPTHTHSHFVDGTELKLTNLFKCTPHFVHSAHSQMLTASEITEKQYNVMDDITYMRTVFQCKCSSSVCLFRSQCGCGVAVFQRCLLLDVMHVDGAEIFN